MAKFFKSKKWKKGLTAGLAVALSATLSLGILSACGEPAAPDDGTEETPTLPTDTQLIKNGDFEFYNEMEKATDERRALINSPQSWSASSSSPSTQSASGIINVEDWNSMSRSTFSLIRAEDRKDESSSSSSSTATLTDEARKYALDNWDKASLYDRVEFYSYYNISADSGFEKYEDYQYTAKFNDLRYLFEDAWGKTWDEATDAEKAANEIKLHDTFNSTDASEFEKDHHSSVLMIHNHALAEKSTSSTAQRVNGTSKYYTSSTDVTLNAGTAAKVSVWVRTMNLVHYENVPVEKRGGAYISVANNVGSNALDQMQINDIITTNNADGNADTNGWEQYTVYIRANNFAATTFHIVLGLGRSTSSDLYEAVDGIAFFDDLKCELIDEETFETAVFGDSTAEPAVEPVVPAEHLCNLEDKENDRKFYSTSRTEDAENGKGKFDTNTNYALDLKAQFDPKNDIALSDENFTLTEDADMTGYTSVSIDPSLGDDRNDASNGSVLAQMSVAELKASAHNYLKPIAQNDFAKFPFDANEDVIMMFSRTGAAYTATLGNVLSVPAHQRMLLSFWVKTSALSSGISGAGAKLILDTNKEVNAVIDPFIATNVDPVDVGEDKDIYDGWVQCFFYVDNDTDVPASFTLELTYGPTSIGDCDMDDFSDGYAAFTHFETYGEAADRPFTRAQYNYVETGSYAKKLSVSGTDISATFDSAAMSGNSLEDGLALPANYTGVQAGSDVLVSGGTPNPNMAELNANGIYAGLLSSEYAEDYFAAAPTWVTELNKVGGATDGKTWWKNLFSLTSGSTANPALQPLVLLNTNTEGVAKSYGFIANSKSTSFSANSSTKVEVRLKVKQGTTAYIYLMDAENEYKDGLGYQLPKVTYWYDDDGNIVNMDPSDEAFDKDGKILYRLQENGLYKNEQDKNDTKLYANLANFDKDDDGNLVTPAGTPAFYFNKDKYYAYREEAGNSYTYKTEVTALPTTGDFVRYPETAGQKAVIPVEGSDEWVTVSFFVRTGAQEKKYRIELWAGERDYTAENGKKGFPAGGYVFFDSCTTSSVSDFATALSDREKELLLDAKYQAKNPNYTEGGTEPATIDDKIDSKYASYYTYTLYDSADFERYDKTTDEAGVGNPWRDYEQSAEEEKIAFLFFNDTQDGVFGISPTIVMFMDFEVYEKEVEKAPALNEEVEEEETPVEDEEDTASENSGDIWLYLASGALAFVLLFTIGAIVFRKLWKKYKKTAKAKAPKKQRAPKPAKSKDEKVVSPEETETPETETPTESPDENDPYNE